MKIRTSLLALAIIGSFGSSSVMADPMRGMSRMAFSTDVTRTSAAGRTIHRHTEQTVSQSQLQRTHQVKTGAGNTASRVVTGSYDSATNTVSRQVEGTRLNGDNYQTNRSLQLNQDGYNQTLTHTNASGATASKQVDVVVDAEAQTITKTITATNYQGESKSGSLVKSYQANVEE